VIVKKTRETFPKLQFFGNAHGSDNFDDMYDISYRAFPKTRLVFGNALEKTV
jgi:hypothetical protein